ncbi:hypothetical protein ACCS33_05900 [Rhizobium ruizarguesonis]
MATFPYATIGEWNSPGVTADKVLLLSESAMIRAPDSLGCGQAVFDGSNIEYG